MLEKIKKHFNKQYNLIFWILFIPAMVITLSGVYELYTKYFDLLTRQDHMQFFIRFFFPVSLAAYITVLERRQRKQKKALIKGIKTYLKRKRSAK